jgi:integrase
MPTHKLTPAFIARATTEPGAERTIYWDETQPGFGLMVTRNGHRSFVVQYRAGHTSRRMTIPAVLPLDRARKEARGRLGEVARGGDPLGERRKEALATKNTLRAVCEEYLARDGKKLRSVDQRRAMLERIVYPKLGVRQIDDIKRSDIVRLLDEVEDNRGPVMADHTLAVLRRVLNWHASRSDEFRTPIVRGMARTKPKEHARKRILSDIELQAFWKATEPKSAYTRMLRFTLLTATRLREASNMQRGELNGEWLIPARRHKSGHDHLIPLSDAARAALDDLPVLGKQGWVFTTSGDTPISGFTKFKLGIDKAMLVELRKLDPNAGLERWTTHDLRRTARSLMSRAGIDPDHAERCLGHVIPGIRGVYDLHEFIPEKRRAFEALASQVERIVNPQPNVLPMRGR